MDSKFERVESNKHPLWVLGKSNVNSAEHRLYDHASSQPARDHAFSLNDDLRNSLKEQTLRQEAVAAVHYFTKSEASSYNF